MRDPEYPRQPGGLLPERLPAFQHDHVFPAPRQLVGRRETTYPRADDDDHVFHPWCCQKKNPAWGASGTANSRSATTSAAGSSVRASPAMASSRHVAPPSRTAANPSTSTVRSGRRSVTATPSPPMVKQAELAGSRGSLTATVTAPSPT